MYSIRPTRPPRPKKTNENAEQYMKIEGKITNEWLRKTAQSLSKVGQWQKIEISWTDIGEICRELYDQRKRAEKYEAALLSMSKYVQTCHRCIYEENSEQCARKNGYDDSICHRGVVDYYKKQAGLEG